MAAAPIWLRTAQTAGIIVGSRLGGALATVVTLLLLARTLEPEGLGIYVAVQAVATVASLLAAFNLESAALRYLPKWRTTHQGHVRAFARHTVRTLSAGLPLAIVMAAIYLAIASTTDPGVLALAGLVTALAAISRIAGKFAYAMGKVAASALTLTLLRPGVLAVIIGVLMLSGHLDLTAALLASAVSFGVTALWQLWQVRDLWRAQGEMPTADPAWRRTGMALLPAGLLIDEFPNLVTLIGALVLDEAELALLAVALRFVLLLRMATKSVILAAGPDLSALAGNGKTRAAQRLGRRLTLLAASIAMAGGFVLFLAAGPLLAVFGPEFTDAKTTLRVLLLVPLITGLFGPSLILLTASGSNRSLFRTSVAGTLFIIVGIGLGGLGGLVGAAIGLVIGTLVWEVALYRAVRREAGVNVWLPAGLGEVWRWRRRQPRTEAG
jgi:O-antigen/teichoic acid export membrane protein